MKSNATLVYPHALIDSLEHMWLAVLAQLRRIVGTQSHIPTPEPLTSSKLAEKIMNERNLGHMHTYVPSSWSGPDLDPRRLQTIGGGCGCSGRLTESGQKCGWESAVKPHRCHRE